MKGPKYAGQEAAAVSVLPYRDYVYCTSEHFHVFMKKKISSFEKMVPHLKLL